MSVNPLPSPDPVFPLLPAALDPYQAGKAFQAALATNGRPVRQLQCQIERSRVKRGRKAVIGYRLVGVDQHGQAFDQQAMIALWPDGEAAKLSAMGGEVSPSTVGPGSFEVTGLAGRAWLFPNDRKVHAIRNLLEAIPEAVTQGAQASGLQIAHYVPEQGCTVRLALPHGAAYGKARADDRAAVAAKVGQGSTPAGIRLAAILHHDPEKRIMWQKEVAGTPVAPSAISAAPRLWSARLAVAVHAFHAIDPPAGLKSLTVDSLAANIVRRAERTAGAMPSLAREIEHLSAKLTAKRPEPSKLALSHCDLHLANLLWDDESFALIDLDTCALAPPALDFGSLCAALIHTAIEAGATDIQIVTIISELRRAARVDGFDWFVAASLLGERLYRCGTRLKSPAPATRSRLIAHANLALETCDA